MTSAPGVRARALLACGAAAGPLFTLAWIVEGATRAGYDQWRHPISSLAIGDLGWMQSTTFLVTGALTAAFALGLRRTLPVEASIWAPRLIGAVGVGLVGAGMFVTDPMNGYPAGTPDLPDPYTFTGRLHRLFSALVFIGLPVACFNLGRWFRRWQQASWAWYSIASGIGFLVAFVLASAGFAQVNGMQDLAGGFQRAALTIGWTWLTLLAVHYLRRSGPP